MALRYSFHVVVPRARTTALLEAVALHVIDEHRAQLLAALPWQPQIDSQRLLANCEIATDARGIAGGPSFALATGSPSSMPPPRPRT